MNEVVGYGFPSALAEKWWMPLELMRFHIQFSDSKQCIRITAEKNMIFAAGVAAYEDARRQIKRMQIEYLADSYTGSIDKNGQPMLIVYGISEEIALSEFSSRVLIASGAVFHGLAFKSRKFKALYLCPTSLVVNWISSLHEQNIFVDTSALSAEELKHFNWQMLPPDYAGCAREDSISVIVYTGCGLDIATNRTTYYLALDYERKIFQPQRKYDVLMKKIETALLELGAQPIDL